MENATENDEKWKKGCKMIAPNCWLKSSNFTVKASTNCKLVFAIPWKYDDWLWKTTTNYTIYTPIFVILHII